MEMLRRFLLVGMFVVWPFHQGSIMQVAMANLTSILYFSIQLQAMPYRKRVDDILALGCSLSLCVMFLCTIFYKYASLVQLPDIRDRMSIEQRDDFAIAGLLLTIIFMVCVFGALGLSAALLVIQMAKDRRMSLAMRAEAFERREIRAVLDELHDADRRAKLQKALDIMDDSSDSSELKAASYLFGHEGLDPIYWGVSKEQLIEFGREVREALHRGEIKGQSDPSMQFYYPQWKFDDPAIGPNMHQVRPTHIHTAVV
jgi:hypothetical protein